MQSPAERIDQNITAGISRAGEDVVGDRAEAGHESQQGRARARACESSKAGNSREMLEAARPSQQRSPSKLELLLLHMKDQHQKQDDMWSCCC